MYKLPRCYYHVYRERVDINEMYSTVTKRYIYFFGLVIRFPSYISSK